MGTFDRSYRRTAARWAATLLILALLACSNSDKSPTQSDLPKDDTMWLRVSTRGMAPIVTVHAKRIDAESGDQPAGVAASPINDADPTLYAFRNIDAYEPDVTGWTLRLESNPSTSGICVQDKPDEVSPQLTLCSELEAIAAP